MWSPCGAALVKTYADLRMKMMKGGDGDGEPIEAPGSEQPGARLVRHLGVHTASEGDEGGMVKLAVADNISREATT